MGNKRKWKHPHVRGEDSAVRENRYPPIETPPRAWGRLCMSPVIQRVLGNTPTCVGKTTTVTVSYSLDQKHPHVRGEDWISPWLKGCATETPPRAWGRRAKNPSSRAMPRNTPTCVGKTPAADRGCRAHTKHPHVRGEDQFGGQDIAVVHETPPRAWGRLNVQGLLHPDLRNTPTCVGKTMPSRAHQPSSAKHPHVRGEDTSEFVSEEYETETPPRAWGRH